MADSPQALVLMQVALVYTGAGTGRRPRMLITACDTEGVDPKALADEWLNATKSQQTFTVVHDLRAPDGFPARPVLDHPSPLSDRLFEETAHGDLPDEGVKVIANGKRS